MKTILTLALIFTVPHSCWALGAFCDVSMKLEGLQRWDLVSSAELAGQKAQDLKNLMETLPGLDNHLLVSTTDRAKEQHLADLQVQKKVDQITASVAHITQTALEAGQLDESLEKILLGAYYTIQGGVQGDKGYFSHYGVRINESDARVVYDFLISDAKQENRAAYLAKTAGVRQMESQVQALRQPALDLQVQMEKLVGLDNHVSTVASEKAKLARIQQWGIQRKIDALIGAISDLATRAERGGYLTEAVRSSLLGTYYTIQGEVDYGHKGYFISYGLHIRDADGANIYKILIKNK